MDRLHLGKNVTKHVIYSICTCLKGLKQTVQQTHLYDARRVKMSISIKVLYEHYNLWLRGYHNVPRTALITVQPYLILCHTNVLHNNS